VGTGIITTAIILIVGYVIISRMIGLAFRLVIPLVLIMILGGAGVFSGLVSDHAPYGQPPHSLDTDNRNFDDLRLRDITTMATDIARTALRGLLVVLDKASGSEPEMRSRLPDETRHIPRDGQADFYGPAPSWNPPSRNERTY
jgi:hypothetical protein